MPAPEMTASSEPTVAPRPVGADDERFQPADRAAWRAWLAAHHARAIGVWAVTYRRAVGKPVVGYDDLVEEALCFGWIDSRRGKLDDGLLLGCRTSIDPACSTGPCRASRSGARRAR